MAGRSIHSPVCYNPRPYPTPLGRGTTAKTIFGGPMKSWITRTLVLAMLMVCIAGVAQAQSAATTHPAGNPPVAAQESSLAGQLAEAPTEANLVLPDLNSATFLGGITGRRLLVYGLIVCL